MTPLLCKNCQQPVGPANSDLAAQYAYDKLISAAYHVRNFGGPADAFSMLKDGAETMALANPAIEPDENTEHAKWDFRWMRYIQNDASRKEWDA